MEHEHFSERLSSQSPDVLPAQGVASEIDCERGRIASQVKTLEYLALIRDFTAPRKDDEPASYEKLEAFFASHATEEEGVRTFERIHAFTRSCEDREWIIRALSDGTVPDDWRYEGGLDDLRRQIQYRLESHYVQPFGKFHQDVLECGALSDSVFRRDLRHRLQAKLEKLCNDHYLYLDDMGNEGPRWFVGVYGETRQVRMRRGSKKESLTFSVGHFLKNSLEAFQLMEFEEVVHDTLPPINHAQVRSDTLSYGAKNANLLEIQRKLDSFRMLMKRVKVSLEIPRFAAVPASLYESYMRGENIDVELRTWYEWMGGEAVHVRSSAVYGEDNEHVTGAGVYDTVEVAEGADFASFKSAVEQVYRSVESETAVRYRTENNIQEQEKMGLTLMKTLYSGASEKGYGNSSRAYAPTLMDVVTEDGQRPIFMKETIKEIFSQNGDSFLDPQFYQVDTINYTHSRLDGQQAAAYLMLLLEQSYGRPVQLEFVGDERNMHILQTRILPAIHSSQAAFPFPDAKPMGKWSCLGLLDRELDILPHSRANRDKDGLVVFRGSFHGSNTRPELYFPGSGAVLVLSRSKQMSGHIETLCLEKGLTCLFVSPMDDRSDCPNVEVEYSSSVSDEIAAEDMPNVLSFNGLERVRVVANGIEARIYNPADIA